MSLVGTRPPTVDEYEQYELGHHMHNEREEVWTVVSGKGKARVINKMPDAKLLILGQGGNKDYLERLIKDYKLEDSIKLLGYKSNPYIYMVRSDIFAFSSVYEGLGNILVECMASVICNGSNKGISQNSRKHPDCFVRAFWILAPAFILCHERINGVRPH